MNLQFYEDYLIEYGIVSDEALELAYSLCGRSEETLDSIMYIKSGYHDLEQYLEYEDRETYRQLFDDDNDDEDDD